ncbi:MAG: C4-type zinc ribbon domain-containing protein [Thermodesulfovibrionales bacterium]
MNEQLQLLIDLQKLDTLILSSRMRIDAIPATLSSHEVPLKNAEAACEAQRQLYAALEKKKKDKEGEIEELRERTKKLKQRSSDIKNNKEYQAHLKEIEKVEKDLKGAEDTLLGLMESLEEASRRLKEETSRVAGEKARVEGVRKELEGEVRQREREVKELKEQRKKLVSRIEGDLYTVYTNIMKASRGLAVVEAKNEICQGCNLHIPPQMFVEIRVNAEIIECPQCRRILYYTRPEEEAPNTAGSGGE